MKRHFKREYQNVDFLARHPNESSLVDFFGALLKKLGYEDMTVTVSYDRIRGVDVFKATWTDAEDKIE